MLTAIWLAGCTGIFSSPSPQPGDSRPIPLDSVLRECNDWRPKIPSATLIDCDEDLTRNAEPNPPADWVCFFEADHPRPGQFVQFWRGPGEGVGVRWSFGEGFDAVDGFVVSFALDASRPQLVGVQSKAGFVAFDERVPVGDATIVGQLYVYTLHGFDSIEVDPATHEVRISDWEAENAAVYLSVFDDPPIYMAEMQQNQRDGQRFVEPFSITLRGESANGTYDAEIEVEDAWGLTAVWNKTVPEYPQPLLPIDPDPACTLP
ncbi:MAG: hypothetical protein AABY18_10170 [Candidatus Thermoplasmatota archaeon]